MEVLITPEVNFSIKNYLGQFTYKNGFFTEGKSTLVEEIGLHGLQIPKFVNEFWTSKQRQACSLHEVSYRACFKPQLPRFFINLLTKQGDIVYDPFAGRGTTIIEAALCGRNVIANDINPLSKILSSPRLLIPNLKELKIRLDDIKIIEAAKADIDLSMFYHPKTEAELVSLKDYLQDRKDSGNEDELDMWIRMVATNRLTGHSKGFFSVYTLPPNQATYAEKQKKINEKRNQIPEYRDTKKIIFNKSEDLLKDLDKSKTDVLREISSKALFLNTDARSTKDVPNSSIKLTVTSPPFLNIVQYAADNWLRCWFNGINVDEISKKITMSKNLNDWCNVMGDVFKELFRITKHGGWVAFEVGEVRNGKIKLDEYVVSLGINAGFKCEGIMINQQEFTKTSNLWGVKNNENGTNSNRIVLFNKV